MDGKSGFLRNSEDVAGFAEAIRTLKNDAVLCRCCGDFNRETVKAYCLEQVKDEVLSLFEEL